MFDISGATTVRQRMDELQKFIDFWYGPHDSSYECHELSEELPLPLTLFYRLNARRPAVKARVPDAEFFYEGDGGHHLFSPPNLGLQSTTHVKFFMEYQGDFEGLTLKREEDPPVWLEGFLPDDALYAGPGKEGKGRLVQTLSEFLVTHVLLVSLYEYDNVRLTLHDSVRDPSRALQEFTSARADSRPHLGRRTLAQSTLSLLPRKDIPVP